MASDANVGVDKLTTFGKMALEQGWYDQAREYFQQALALDATNRAAMKGLARVDEIFSRKVAMAAKPMRVYATPQASRADAGSNISGCIVSFLFTCGFAITVGLAVLFIVAIIATEILGPLGLSGGGADFFPIAVRTGIVYLALFGVAWWAIYKMMSTRK